MKKNLLICLILWYVILPVTNHGFAIMTTPDVMKLESKLKAAEKLKNFEKAAVYSEALANIYDSKEQYNKAVRYYRKSASYWGKIDQSEKSNKNLVRAEEIDTEIKLLIEKKFEGDKKIISIDKIQMPNTLYNCIIYVKLPLGRQPDYISVYQGKRKLGESFSEPWELQIDFSVVNSKQPITIMVYDNCNQLLAQKDVKSLS